jgi:hypothetical protein
MSSSRPNIKNTNVSSSVLSRSERCEIAKLSVRPEKRSHGNVSAPVWKYFGELWHDEDSAASVSASSSTTSVSSVCLDKDHRYCLLCLQREHKRYGTSQGSNGHISRIGKYSRNTSTSSLRAMSMSELGGFLSLFRVYGFTGIYGRALVETNF